MQAPPGQQVRGEEWVHSSTLGRIFSRTKSQLGGALAGTGLVARAFSTVLTTSNCVAATRVFGGRMVVGSPESCGEWGRASGL